jgi:hypothetical protein
MMVRENEDVEVMIIKLKTKPWIEPQARSIAKDEMVSWSIIMINLHGWKNWSQVGQPKIFFKMFQH